MGVEYTASSLDSNNPNAFWEGISVISTILIIFVAGCLFTCLSPGAIYNLPPVDSEIRPDGLYQLHSSEAITTKPLNFYVHTACFLLVIFIYFNILDVRKIKFVP